MPIKTRIRSPLSFNNGPEVHFSITVIGLREGGRTEPHRGQEGSLILSGCCVSLGASIKYVYKIFGFFDPPCPQLELIYLIDSRNLHYYGAFP